jgi:peptidoglycan/LPS O-acetylase OafA/YrhL
VSAVLIGFIATTLPLSEYFTHPEFFRYLRNMYGDIVLTLPGVTFLPPYPNVVNGVIWTVPVDLGGYALMVVLILVGLQKRPLFVTSLALFLLAIPTLIVALHADALASYLATAPHLYFLDNVRGSTLIPSFLLGAAAYTVRDRLPWHPAFGLVAVAVLAILGAMGDVSFLHRNFVANVLMCTASVVLMVAIGCADLRRVTPPGDYSYGLFLYTFPIQQLVNTNFHVSGVGGFIFHFLASLALGLVFAVFSCHCVEQPMLRWRRQFNLRRRNLAETTRAKAEREAGALRFDSAGRDPGQ